MRRRLRYLNIFLVHMMILSHFRGAVLRLLARQLFGGRGSLERLFRLFSLIKGVLLVMMNAVRLSDYAPILGLLLFLI